MMTGDHLSVWLGNPASPLGMFLLLIRMIGRVQSFLASPGMLIRLWSHPCYGQKVMYRAITARTSWCNNQQPFQAHLYYALRSSAFQLFVLP